jgi:hypothetical protein
MDNGGGATLMSYGQKEGEVVDVKVVPEQHLRWLEELPLMHIDKHRVYVHAGVEPDQPLDAQDTQTLLWKIYKGPDLCSLFYLDAMGSHALGSIQGLERWIAHLLARKATVRRALARRLQEVLGSVEQLFDNR